jgi:polyhydroxyalkanoate synthase
MSNQTTSNNPLEIFQAFSKESHQFWQSFMTNQGQEMVNGFMQAWNAWLKKSTENPTQWLDIITRYQQEQINLWLKIMNNPVGQPLEAVISPPAGDKRFAAKEWHENPVFSYVKQSYLLAAKLLTEFAENADLDKQSQQKLDFYTQYFINAISPTNFAATNPEVINRAIETKGQSLIDGLKNLLTDLEKGRITMTDESAFQVGKNLAITPGAVIYENELMQLIQYQATTATVSDRPVIIVPPCINKYYILDLKPENSFVKYAVDQGNTVFLISWRNPEKDLSEIGWDDYIQSGVVKAIEIVKAISNTKKVNTVSWCVGGTILATALAVLAKQKDNSVASATFFTTLLDFSEPGEISVFIDEVQIARRESQLKYKGILSGQDLAVTFSMIRANDLIWSYVVNNYLKGQTPTPFDILYWNSDPTHLPAKMYSYYIRNMYMDNKLIEPNALTMCGVPINLGNIKIPSYFLSTIDDHIAPWMTTFTSAQLLGGPIEFILGASGHVAGVINPPAKNKRHYWSEGELGKDPAHWLKTAQTHPGSWWTHWDQWLKKRGGNTIPAPVALGNAEYPLIEPAPGRYVTKRIN